MIKGVNKKIIEVNNPDSKYFDKVVLYVKSNQSTRPNSEVAHEVDRYLDSLINHRGSKPSKRNANSITHVGIDHSAGFIVGMAVVLILLVLLMLV